MKRNKDSEMRDITAASDVVASKDSRKRSKLVVLMSTCITFVLTCVLALGLIGCTSEEAEDEGSSSETTEESDSSTEEEETTSEESEETDEDEDGAETTTASFTFTEDADCSSCHTTESESYEDSDCTASYHSDVTCITCHSDIDGLTEAHEDVEYGDKTATRLKSTEIDTSACISCHGDLETLAELTEDCTILTDDEGTVVNPHDLPDVEYHETVDCGDCHEMHSTDDISETSTSTCLSCHHSGVYECYTCHD